MATRQFEFIVGPETSTQPTAGIPDDDSDLLSLGYAKENYVQGGLSVADITALKAVANDSYRTNGSIRLVRSTNNLYRFDTASSASGDDNFVVTPNAGTGRWIRITLLNRANTWTDTTQSTSKDTGAAIFEGGVGIEKNLNVGGNLEVTGDLTVQGTTTTLNTSTVDVEDANITVNNGGTQSTANTNVAGLRVSMSDATHVRLGYDSSLASRFKAGDLSSESEVMTVGTAQTVSGVKTHTDNIILDNQKAVRFREQTGNGTNYIAITAPDAVTSDTTYKLPNGNPSGTKFLANDGSGTLSWESPGSSGNLTTDASAGSGAGSVTVSSGSTLFHPNLTVSTGDTYTINGSLVSAGVVTVNGTLIINGTGYILN